MSQPGAVGSNMAARARAGGDPIVAPGVTPAPDCQLGGVARNRTFPCLGLAEDGCEPGPGAVTQNRNQPGALGSGALGEEVELRRLCRLFPEGAPVASALLDAGRQCCIVGVDRP